MSGVELKVEPGKNSWREDAVVQQRLEAEGFQCHMFITPAWDKTSPIPGKNYGVHCCDLLMLLVKGDLAVQFVLFTGWYLPQNQHDSDKPLPADLGYHSATPLYDEQSPMGSCAYLGGEACYYDGSGLNARDLFQVMLEQGSGAVWSRLREYWQETYDHREAYAQEQRKIQELGTGHS